MTGRERILAAVRANLPEARPLANVPVFATFATTFLVDRFNQSLVQMGGRALACGPVDEPLAPVREMAAGRRVCSTTSEFPGSVDINRVCRPQDLAGVEIAVVRACVAVAETGSVLLTDQTLGVNALAYLAQHLVVLLDPADIVADLHAAYRRREFSERAYAVFHTGPSATADIEGVLIHGAQGVRSLSVLVTAKG